MSRRFRFAALVIILLGLAALVFKNQNESKVSAVVVERVETPPASTPDSLTASAATATPSETSATVTNFAIDKSNQDLLRSCFAKDASLARVNYTEKLKLEDVLKDLANSNAPQISALMMNVEVKKPDGVRQRLHIAPPTDESKSSAMRWKLGESEARVFAVDSEGLPVSIDYPPDLKAESVKNLVDRFSAEGIVMSRERRTHQDFRGGLAADVLETDGHLNELQLFFNGSSLGCAWQNEHLNCKCL